MAKLVKTQSLPLPIDTPKLQLFTEQLLMRKARRLGEKAFYIKSYQEVTATRWPGGVEMYSQDPYSRGVTLKWDDNWITGVLLVEEESEPCSALPSPGVLH